MNITPAMKRRLQQIKTGEVFCSDKTGFGYVTSRLLGSSGWTYVMQRKLINLKLIRFIPVEHESFYQMQLTELGEATL